MKRTAFVGDQEPPVPGEERVHSAIARAAMWLFPHLLRLYPGQFYSTFADEMVDVFHLAVHDAALRGMAPMLKVLFRELAELPLTLIAEWFYERNKRSMTLISCDTSQEIRLARWVARGLSLLFAGFVLTVMLLNEDVRTDITPPTLILAALSLSALGAWRWERIGGLLTMACAPLLFLSMILQFINVAGLVTPFWVLLLIAAGIAFSFLIVGWLFVSVAQHTQATRTPGAAGGAPVSGKRRRRTTLLVAVLGVVALMLFVIPLQMPVRQNIEILPERHFDQERIITALRAERAVVGVGSIPVQQPFLSVAGQELNVNGEIVQAYVYSDTVSATADASAIYYDTDNLAWTEVAWNDAPHFYQTANVILIYDGRTPEILTVLERAFSPPFAPD